MNGKITQALSAKETGDILKYFEEVDKIINLNDGIHDNKMLSMECYDRPTPVKYNQYTKFHISDAGLDCINIDKSYITASMTYTIKLSDSDTDLTPAASMGAFELANDPDYQIFIGLKNASHNIDTYRIYVNHNQIYSQTDSIYEQSLCTALKPKAEMFRPHMYTMWDSAHKHSQNVCGVYIPIRSNRNKTIDITFDVAFQLDDLLPFSGMSIFPSCVIGDLELEIRNRIQGNLVWCQVEPEALMKENMINSTATDASWDISFSHAKTVKYTKEFTQVGDSAKVAVMYKITNSGVDSYATKSIVLTVECTNSIMNNAMSHINGFRLKDSVISQLRQKYASKPLIIPAQVCKHDLFAQRPTAGGLKLNTNITLTNCTNIALSFPQTDNQISVVHNPEQQSAQIIVMGKNIPDKSINTLEAAHAEMSLTNACLDSLFEAQPSFLRSLTTSSSDGTKKIYVPYDTSDYYFNVSLERFGNGIFCDGLTSPGAITLTFQSNSINSGVADSYYHYDINDNSKLNTQPINIMTVEDCFWVITPDKVWITNDVYTPEITETN